VVEFDFLMESVDLHGQKDGWAFGRHHGENPHNQIILVVSASMVVNPELMTVIEMVRVPQVVQVQPSSISPA
jgi:hypothetical protein